jgi:hypothetical protein
MSRKKRIVLVVLLTLGLALYKPISSYRAHQRECADVTERREFYEAAYDDLRKASKRMATLVDLHELSPSDLTSSSKMEATDYVELYKNISNISLGMALGATADKNDLQALASADISNLKENMRLREEGHKKFIESLESCQRYPEFFASVCTKILMAKVELSDLEWPACEDNDQQSSQALLELMESTVPILRGAMRIKHLDAPN